MFALQLMERLKSRGEDEELKEWVYFHPAVFGSVPPQFVKLAFVMRNSSKDLTCDWHMSGPLPYDIDIEYFLSLSCLGAEMEASGMMNF